MKTSKSNIYLLITFIACMLMVAPITASAVQEIISPTPGSTLSGSTEIFLWTANGATVSAWWLWAGSCNSSAYNSCGDDYYNSGQLGAGTTSATVSGLPTGGGTVYVRLWYNSGGWQSVLFQYTASGGATPEIYNPSPGSTLSGSNVTFSWQANGVSVSAWGLDVGSTLGDADIFCGGGTCDPANDHLTSMEVSGLPCYGSTVYVRLWYNTGGWEYMDYQYTASSSCTSVPEITSPAPGSQLPCPLENLHLEWTANGTAVTSWWLWVGSCNDPTWGGCGDDYKNTGPLLPVADPYSINYHSLNIPSDETEIHVRLWYMTDGVWKSVVESYQLGCDVQCPCFSADTIIDVSEQATMCFRDGCTRQLTVSEGGYTWTKNHKLEIVGEADDGPWTATFLMREGVVNGYECLYTNTAAWMNETVHFTCGPWLGECDPIKACKRLLIESSDVQFLVDEVCQ